MNFWNYLSPSEKIKYIFLAAIGSLVGLGIVVAAIMGRVSGYVAALVVSLVTVPFFSSALKMQISVLERISFEELSEKEQKRLKQIKKLVGASKKLYSRKQLKILLLVFILCLFVRFVLWTYISVTFPEAWEIVEWVRTKKPFIELVVGPETYLVGEIVTIKIKNNFPKPAFYIKDCGEEPLDVYKYENNQWKQVHKHIEEKCPEETIVERIEGGESVEISYSGAWKTLFEAPGKYKIGIVYGYSEVQQDKTASSNEFRIKGKREPECYQDPRKALDDFLAYLHGGQYEKAAGLYAGDYPFERARISPDQMTEKEHINFIAWFLEDFCRGYGTCLEHRIVSEKVLSEDEVGYYPSFPTVLFGVQFLEENGELFELVAPEGVDRSVATEFGLRVVEIDGCYRSVDIPPITP